MRCRRRLVMVCVCVSVAESGGKHTGVRVCVSVDSRGLADG